MLEDISDMAPVPLSDAGKAKILSYKEKLLPIALKFANFMNKNAK